MRSRVTVVGTGYVGLSIAVLLSSVAEVTAFDIDERKLDLLRRGRSPIADPDIEARLASGTAPLTFTSDPVQAYADAGLVVIATPTDYD